MGRGSIQIVVVVQVLVAMKWSILYVMEEGNFFVIMLTNLKLSSLAPTTKITFRTSFSLLFFSPSSSTCNQNFYDLLASQLSSYAILYSLPIAGSDPFEKPSKCYVYEGRYKSCHPVSNFFLIHWTLNSQQLHAT